MDENGPRGDTETRRLISAAQFAIIKNAAERDRVFLEAELAGAAPTHIWQRDHIMLDGDVDEKDNGELRRLGAVLAPDQDGGEQAVAPDLVKLIRLENNRFGSTREAVGYLNEQPSLAGRVYLNNLLYVSHGDGANLCAGDEPTPLRPYPQTIPYPPPSGGNGGEGVRIEVIDTGLYDRWEENHPWLYDPNRDPSTEVQGDFENGTFGPNQLIQSHAGHGAFIAGIIRCVAPRATINVRGTLRWAGSMHEWQVARTIIDALKDEPDIISLSAGCTIADWAHHKTPRAMLDVLRRLRDKNCRTILVAAAGNDGHGPSSDLRFYPAAFAESDPHGVEENVVVAVGALRQDRYGRACFSNWGDWVTVYEDGERIVNAFPEGTYCYREPLRGATPPLCIYHPPDFEEGCTCVTAPGLGAVGRFHGMAMWSGTSFSTPIVVGRIARHMTDGTTFTNRPRAALQDLLLSQLDTITDVADGTPLRVFKTPVG